VRQPFDLEWLGGVAERHFRKIRPGVDDMPWGTLDPSRYPPRLVDRARISWTEAAYNEYCTAAGFADLLRALLAANAPIDLVGMASDFVADEILHVELTSRIAMELGGGAPYEIDFEDLHHAPSHALSPRQRANQLIVALCCVGEAFSLPMLASALASASHPLTRAVLQRIVQDESPHGRFGWLYLDWARDDLDDAERTRLAEVALATLDHVRELGWTESSAYRVRARAAIDKDVVTPLARYGIAVAGDRLDRLVGYATRA